MEKMSAQMFHEMQRLKFHASVATDTSLEYVTDTMTDMKKRNRRQLNVMQSV